VYAISVGYGLSVGVMGMALRRAFRPVPGSVGDALAGCIVFYGLRLAYFLWLRERSGYQPSSPSSRKEPSRWSRVPFSLSLAFFYTCMTSPVLFVLRNPPPAPLPSSSVWSVATLLANWRWCAAWTGTILAWTGAVLEAVADAHKLSVKTGQQQKKVPLSSAEDGGPGAGGFVGPTGGAFRITRHPNYTGECLHWLGVFVAGSASLVGRRGEGGPWWIGWSTGTAGLFGIVRIMQAATRRLEERQQAKYGGDPDYESWKDLVTAPLIPFVNSNP
jgi:steroid 5-alpha reductase family enzyme